MHNLLGHVIIWLHVILIKLYDAASFVHLLLDFALHRNGQNWNTLSYKWKETGIQITEREKSNIKISNRKRAVKCFG